jgi:hypothetical protein
MTLSLGSGIELTLSQLYSRRCQHQSQRRNRSPHGYAVGLD